MDEAEENKRWAIIAADCFEKILNHYHRKAWNEMLWLINEVEGSISQEESAVAPWDSNDATLSSAWNYADAFVDAAWHGLPHLDSITWDDAVTLLQDIVVKLRTGQPITDPRVLRYAYVPSEGGLKKLWRKIAARGRKDAPDKGEGPPD